MATKQVTVFITDMRGSTSIADLLGDAAHLNDIIKPYKAIMAREIAACGGTPYQVQSDEGDDITKAYFSSVEDAVACLVKINTELRLRGPLVQTPSGKCEVRIRAGVHTADAMGSMLDPAQNGKPGPKQMSYTARVMALADANQIFLSDAAHEAYRAHVEGCSESFQCERRDNAGNGYTFAGILGRHVVHELQYDSFRRAEPGTALIGFEAVEAANAYIARPGKEAEVIKAFFAETVGRSGTYRLVTIHGDGGMGKTRLAVHCAMQIAGEFPGGVVFVSLADVPRSQEAVAEAILLKLGIKPEPQQSVAQLVSFLTTRRKMLLVLDNMESVTGGELQSLLKKLLVVPTVSILGTSRQMLGMDNREYEVNIDDGMTDDEATQLFIERSSAQHQVAPPNADDPRLRELFVEACHIPLAIELLAVWWHKYPSVEKLLMLYREKVLGLLTRLPKGRSVSIHGGDAEEKRHCSLEASCHWSWENLGESSGVDAQATFVAASLFVAPFTEEVVAIVLGWNDTERVADAMEAVQNASLIRPMIDDYGTVRYRMHRFLQAYGQEECFRAATQTIPLPETPGMRIRFFSHYFRLSRELDGYVKGTQGAAARAWFDSEWRNVDKASDYTEANWGIPNRFNLNNYFSLTSRWKEWEEVVSKTYKDALKYGNTYYQTSTLINLGIIYRSQRRWEKAIEAYDQVVIISRSCDDKTNEARALANLGNVYCAQDQWQDAETVIKNALILFEALGDKYGEGNALNGLGTVYTSQNRWQEAVEVYNASLSVKRSIGDRHGESHTLANLGILYFSKELWQESEEAYSASLAIKKSIGDMHGEGNTLHNLCRLYLAQNKIQEATDYARQAVNAFAQTQDSSSFQLCQELLAHCENLPLK